MIMGSYTRDTHDHIQVDHTYPTGDALDVSDQSVRTNQPLPRHCHGNVDQLPKLVPILSEYPASGNKVIIFITMTRYSV